MIVSVREVLNKTNQQKKSGSNSPRYKIERGEF